MNSWIRLIKSSSPHIVVKAIGHVRHLLRRQVLFGFWSFWSLASRPGAKKRIARTTSLRSNAADLCLQKQAYLSLAAVIHAKMPSLHMASIESISIAHISLLMAIDLTCLKGRDDTKYGLPNLQDSRGLNHPSLRMDLACPASCFRFCHWNLLEELTRFRIRTSAKETWWTRPEMHHWASVWI